MVRHRRNRSEREILEGCPGYRFAHPGYAARGWACCRRRRLSREAVKRVVSAEDRGAGVGESPEHVAVGVTARACHSAVSFPLSFANSDVSAGEIFA
jgi:hypothetical protein